jgi:pyrroloquinoline quinone biosynthesis protein B
MLIRVLGAAAGGGFPQWNCSCFNCRRARAGDPAVKPRSQASLAVSADGDFWVLLNASPDLPEQLRGASLLQPWENGPPRNSPVQAVVLSGADIDCIAGLLSLREGHAFNVYAPGFVLDILRANPVFGVLDPARVGFSKLRPEAPLTLLGSSNRSLGLTVECFPVPGKLPLYQEAGRAITDLVSDDAVIGLEIRDAAGSGLLFIPGCARVTVEILRRAARSKILFFDGTLWTDDEMISAGLSTKTGARMGHISVSGPEGSIAGFTAITAPRKIFFHINNTNPMLRDDSPQGAFVRQAGWEVAYDGMEITL